MKSYQFGGSMFRFSFLSACTLLTLFGLDCQCYGRVNETPFSAHDRVFLDNSEEEPEKIYVEPGQLAFVDHEIFANIKGDWVRVRSILSDQTGLYVHNYPYTRWICKCGYNNDGADTACQNPHPVTGKKCGKPRPE